MILTRGKPFAHRSHLILPAGRRRPESRHHLAPAAHFCEILPPNTQTLLCIAPPCVLSCRGNVRRRGRSSCSTTIIFSNSATEGRAIYDARTYQWNTTLQYLEIPSVVTPSECPSHIVREGNDMCQRTVIGNRTKKWILFVRRGKERVRDGREQLSVHRDWNLGVER